MPFGLILASFDFAQDFSSTPVKYWRTIIEPGGLGQGRPSTSLRITTENREGRLYTLDCSGRRLIPLPGFNGVQRKPRKTTV